MRLLPSGRRAFALVLWTVAVAGGCGDGMGPGADGCAGELCDRATLDELGLDPFYRKHLDAGGIPVISSGKVPDAALYVAREIVNHMLRDRPDVRQAMIGQGARVGSWP